MQWRESRGECSRVEVGLAEGDIKYLVVVLPLHSEVSHEIVYRL